jgi:hypothetical protein
MPSYEAAPSHDLPPVFAPAQAYEPASVGSQVGFEDSTSVADFLSPWAVPAADNRVDDLPNPADDPLYISDDEPENDAPMTKTGFRKRIKGAQAPDTGPADGTPAPERDAAALRSSLAGLQSGFDRAKRG